MSAEDRMLRYLCERIIQEAKKIVDKGYNAKIVCDDPEIREREEKSKQNNESACG